MEKKLNLDLKVQIINTFTELDKIYAGQRNCPIFYDSLRGFYENGKAKLPKKALIFHFNIGKLDMEILNDPQLKERLLSELQFSNLISTYDSVAKPKNQILDLEEVPNYYQPSFSENKNAGKLKKVIFGDSSSKTNIKESSNRSSSFNIEEGIESLHEKMSRVFFKGFDPTTSTVAGNSSLNLESKISWRTEPVQIESPKERQERMNSFIQRTKADYDRTINKLADALEEEKGLSKEEATNQISESIKQSIKVASELKKSTNPFSHAEIENRKKEVSERLDKFYRPVRLLRSEKFEMIVPSRNLNEKVVLEVPSRRAADQIASVKPLAEDYMVHTLGCIEKQRIKQTIKGDSNQVSYFDESF